MFISDVLRTKGYNVVRIHPTDSIELAVRKLAEHRIGALVVEDRWMKPIGVFSERDFIVAVARRLAVVLHRMWVDGSEFRWSKDSTAVPAAGLHQRRGPKRRRRARLSGTTTDVDAHPYLSLLRSRGCRARDYDNRANSSSASYRRQRAEGHREYR